MTFPSDPLGMIDHAYKAAREAGERPITDDRSAVVSKYDRTPMDDLAEAESEAWFEERER